MLEKTPDSLMYEVISLVQELNRIRVALFRDGSRFSGDVSQSHPVFSPPELGFLRAVSWFYVFFFEVGRTSVEYLDDKLGKFALGQSADVISHLKVIQNLRTYLQHNLNPLLSHDEKILHGCQDWFERSCGTRLPHSDAEWTTCLVALLQCSLTYMKALERCMRAIERDDARTQLLDEWKIRESRLIPPHKFDEVIDTVAKDFGRDNLDAPRLRKRYLDKWNKALDALQWPFDIDHELRKLIEHTLLNDSAPVLPLTGVDIMSTFAIPPGPDVARILDIAREEFTNKPCTKGQLLERLKVRLSISENQ